MHWKILALVVLVCVGSCWQFQRRQIFGESSEPFVGQDQYWFTQILDHFNYFSTKTWQQRYFVLDRYFKSATGPVILNICGEGECRGIGEESFTAQIAKETRGIVLSLQHRYYGQSKPFGNESFTFENMRYLNSELALRDLAYFIQSISKSHLYGITEDNPWITIGGSYSGALAAWFRSKYPHLTIGSIGSSGVILAVEDFKDFDEQIYISAKKSGDFCPTAIKALSDYVEDQVTGENKDAFKAQFNSEKLTARQFLFYWSDALVFQIQYGNRVPFCNALKNKTLEEQFAVAKELVKKVSPTQYGSYYIKESTYESVGVGIRPWYYQSCTEFSFFQTYSEKHPMRSKLLTIDFYRKYCEDLFQPGLWPYVDRVNNQFGGLNIKADHLIMTNGAEGRYAGMVDPWQWASLRESKNKNIYAHVIDCDDCAHCVDLRGSKSTDAKDLTATRAIEMQSVKGWIQDYWNSKAKANIETL